MKKLNLYTGGHPRSLNDLIHLQEGVSETIDSFLKGLTNSTAGVQNCILWGMGTSYSGPNLIVADGAVLLNGEVCLFSSQNLGPAIPPPGSNWLISITETYIAGNPVTYANASSHNVHAIRKATISVSSATPSASQLIFNPPNTPKFKDIMQAQIAIVDTWHTLGDPGEPTLNNNYNATYFKFKKTVDGEVKLVAEGLEMDYWTTLGGVPEVFSSAEVLFTLPVGHRPSSIVFIAFPCEMPSANNEMLGLQIAASGEVKIGTCKSPNTGNIVNDYGGVIAYINCSFMAV